VLHVEDLLDAYDAAIERIDRARGEVYNMGGGATNVLAVWTEFGPLLEKLLGHPIPVSRGDWRPGDQKVFYADYSKAERELGWKPRISLEEGIERLYNWVRENKDLF
jgi:CDP-paratose 2-epimerase